MKTVGAGWAMLMAVGAVALLSGCEVSKCDTPDGGSGSCTQATSLTRWEPPEWPAPTTVAWSSGKKLTVNGIYGHITVNQGAAADSITVAFKPFDYRAADKEAEATQELNNDLQTSATADATTGDVNVTVARTSELNGLGADIEIQIPAAFDSVISLTNQGDGPINPGEVTVNAVGNATQVAIDNSYGLGDCVLVGNATVTKTQVGCHGSVDVSGVSDAVAIVTTGLDGDVTLSFAGIAATTMEGNKVQTEDGNINVAFPAAGGFSINATATDGVVNTGTVPSTCAVSGTAPTVVTCGTGPGYTLTAGSSVGTHDVTLNFQ